MFWVIGICKEYEGCGSVKVKECDKMNDSVMLMWTMIAAVCTAASTLVYTIATIIICRANAKSAAAAAEQSQAMQIQTQELIRQYHDSTRARIAIRFGYDNAIGKYLILKNVGIHDADNVRVAINKEFLDELARDLKCEPKKREDRKDDQHSDKEHLKTKDSTLSKRKHLIGIDLEKRKQVVTHSVPPQRGFTA